VVDVRDPEVLAQYQKDPKIVVETTSGLNLNYIIMDTSKKPFSDLRVRKAVSYAVNKRALLETVLKGIGVDLTGPVPASANFYEPDVERYGYNPEKAKKLLSEAGYPNGFKTTLYTYIRGPAVPVSTAVQDQLKKVGIQAELKALEIAAWMDVVTTGTTPMSYMRLTRPPDPDGFLLTVAHSKSDPQWNFGHFKNDRIDQLIDEGRRVSDPKKRAGIYSEIQKLIVENAPNVWIFSDIISTAHRSSLKGFKLDALWNKLLYEAYVEK
jgi:peptide/nickel transport system substrate-binding protein